MRKLRLALDVDDVLLNTNQYGLDVCNKKYHFSPPLELSELKQWGKQGTRSDVIFECYSDPEFYRNLQPLPGAQKFIWELSRRGYELLIVTAIAPEFMGIRVEQIQKFFPEIPVENIICATNKSPIQADVLLDDGAHNIQSSQTTYPVLFRKPWNQSMSGCLSVNTYADFLTLLDMIWPVSIPSGPYRNLVLVGPSGSGKHELIQFARTQGVRLVASYTTRQNAPKDQYCIVSPEKFQKLVNAGWFWETSVYAGERYGLARNQDEAESDHPHIVAMDISGAIAMKQADPKTCLIYVERRKESLVQSIIDDSNLSSREKTLRICSLEDERKNRDLCDIVLKNNENDHAKSQLQSLFF